MYDPETEEAMRKAMFGHHSIHLPLNFIAQKVAEPPACYPDSVLAVAQTTHGTDMLFGGTKTHMLILGDVVIRPRLVIESDHLVGAGLAGLARDGFRDVDAWLKHGNVIVNT